MTVEYFWFNVQDMMRMYNMCVLLCFHSEVNVPQQVYLGTSACHTVVAILLISVGTL